MEKKQIWNIIGIASFGMTIGLLIGASQSPIVGVAITSIFGVLATLFTIYRGNSEQGNKLKTVDSDIIGKTLFALCLFIIVGTYAGSTYRASLYKKERFIIWENSVPPKTAEEAFDWIRVEEILDRKGFTKQQMQAIYKIKLEQKNDTISDYSGFSPLYKILTDGEVESYDIATPAK